MTTWGRHWPDGQSHAWRRLPNSHYRVLCGGIDGERWSEPYPEDEAPRCTVCEVLDLGIPELEKQIGSLLGATWPRGLTFSEIREKMFGRGLQTRGFRAISSALAAMEEDRRLFVYESRFKTRRKRYVAGRKLVEKAGRVFGMGVR